METVSERALAAICGASTAILVGVAIWARRRRGRVPGARAFALLSAAQASWTIGHLFEVLSHTFPGKLLWDSLQNVPYGALAPAALLTAAQYGRFRIRRGWIAVVAVVTMLLASAIVYLRLVGADGYTAQLAGHPPALTYPFTALDNLLGLVTFASFVLAAALLMVDSGGGSRHSGATHALALSLAIPPLSTAVAMALGLRLLGDRDVSPATFALGALVAAWGLGRYQLFEITPVARGRILERLPVGVLVLDRALHVVDINREGAALLGAPVVSIAGRPLREALAVWPALAELAGVDEEITRDLPGPGPAADGRWFAVTWTPLRDPEGMPAGGSLLIRDVSDSHRATQDAENRLALSEERFRTLFDQTFQLICVLDRNGGLLTANRAARACLGPAASEVAGRPLVQTPWGAALRRSGVPLADGIARAGGGEFVRFESDCILDGEARSFDVSLTRARDPAAGTIQVLMEARDITALREEQRRSERLALQLQSAQRLEALGRLASGVAHDFNNILTVVNGNLNLLKEEVGNGQPQRDLVDEVLTATRAGSDITRQLLVFSKQQPFTPRVLGVAEALGPARALLRRLLGEDISIEEQWPADLWSVKADPSQLHQVLLNLAINARDAMPDGGRLSIRASNVELDAPAAACIPHGRPGRFVCVEVADTGSGMSDEVMARIFEPFFTTKGDARGTGLGLAIVQSALEQNQGFIQVRSDQGRGARFTFYLPRDPGLPTAQTAPEVRLPRASVGPIAVVVVEDQPAVRRVIERALRHEGYIAHAFAGAQDLLEAAASFRPAPDLLLTDVVLPGMSGPSLADAVARAWPDIKVLFVSGHVAGRPAELPGITADSFLPKPFSPGELAQQVERIVRSGSPWRRRR